MSLRLRGEGMRLTVRALATSAAFLLLAIAPGRAGACCLCFSCPTGVPVSCFTTSDSCVTTLVSPSAARLTRSVMTLVVRMVSLIVR